FTRSCTSSSSSQASSSRPRPSIRSRQSGSPPSPPRRKDPPMKIVAVTACPTGIAHTYMAAEQLEKTAKAAGHTIKLETQGAMGIENELTKADITAADVAIFAVDIEVEKKERFDGK